MEEFPSNVRKTPGQEDKPKAEKIVTGTVSTRPQPLGRRFKDTFIGGDRRSVWEYVLLDVVVPRIKDLIVEAGQDALEKTVYGEVRGTLRRPGGRTVVGSTGSQFNYQGISKPGTRSDPRKDLSREARSAHNFDEIIFQSRYEADAVLERMYEQLREYDVVTVRDLYDFCGISYDFTDVKYGWEDLQGSKVIRDRGDYILSLPRPAVVK